MSHNEYQNQMDYDSQTKEEEMKSIDWVKRNEKMIDFTMSLEEWKGLVKKGHTIDSDFDTEEEEEECCEDNYGEPGCSDGCSGGCCVSCCGMGEEEEVKKLCKNTDCVAEENDEYDESCNICDGYYKDDGLNDILFIQEEPNKKNAICNHCEKTDDIVQMKDTGEYICQNACDEEEDDSEVEEEEEVKDSVGIICKYTEHERKCIELLKCWVKISSPSTFEKDWVKLQENFVHRLGLEGGRVYINKTMDMIGEYICQIACDQEEVEEEEYIKWSDDFVNKDYCYFCGVKNNGDWDKSCEDAVCIDCSEKYEYDENIDSYKKKE